MKYFEKLPIISYNGFTARNLMARAALTNDTRDSRSLYLPYSLEDDMRPDTLAQAYYDNPDYAWLVWMSNNTIDPYYDYYLNDSDFDAFIAKKYGSIEAAMGEPAFYRNNYMNDSTTLTPTAFDNLPAAYKKYYRPLLDSTLRVSAYIRKKRDWVVNTNRIITFTLTTALVDTFQVGERIEVTNDSSINAYVTYADSTTVTCQHVNGTFIPGRSIVGKTSNATAAISDVTVISVAIPEEEYVFWQPITKYDYERELNDQKRNMKLIDNRYKQTIENELRRVLG